MESTTTEYVPPVLTELEELESTYCDLHKDVYGVKARWYRAESVEKARADIDRLQESLQVVMAQEREEQAQAIKDFEKRIDTLLECGASDRATAVRWIHQARDSDGTDDHLCWLLGLPFGYQIRR